MLCINGMSKKQLLSVFIPVAAVCDGGPLSRADLPSSLRTWVPSTQETGSKENLDPEHLLKEGDVSLPDIEERLLREAVRQADGNLSEAARKLGISYKTLRYRVRKLGL